MKDSVSSGLLSSSSSTAMVKEVSSGLKVSWPDLLKETIYYITVLLLNDLVHLTPL